MFAVLLTIISVIGCLYFPAPLAGAPEASLSPFVIESDKANLNISESYLWLEDSSSKLSVAQILDGPMAKEFQNSILTKPPQEYSLSTIWIQFQLENRSDRSRWYLEAVNPAVKRLEVYKVLSHGAEAVQQERIDRRYATVELEMGVNEKATFIAAFQSADILDVDLRLISIHGLAKKDMMDTTALGITAGIFIALIIYNLFLYFSVRHQHYLYYILFAGTNAFMAFYSVNVPYGIGNVSAETFFHFIQYTRFLGPLTSVIFSQYFLQTKENFPVIHRVFNVYNLLLILINVGCFFFADSAMLSTISDPYFFLGIILLFGTGVYAYAQGFEPARFYILGIGCFLAGVAVLLAYPYLGLPANSFTLTAHLIGQAGEMLLMSFAIGSYIKILEEKKIIAETEAVTKSQLLRVISHDILNALSVIKGYGQMLYKKQPNETYLAKILRSANIIEDIAQYARNAERSQSPGSIKLRPVSVAAVFDEISFLYEKMAVEKGVRLFFEVNPQDLWVYAEETSLINGVLGNLVSNAIKFSFTGNDVQVTANAMGNLIFIKVKDCGVGIPKELRYTLLSSHKRITTKGTSGELGNGLGMSIVRSFVEEEYKGKIEMKSVTIEEDDSRCGTEFVVTLKRAMSPLSSSIPENISSEH